MYLYGCALYVARTIQINLVYRLDFVLINFLSNCTICSSFKWIEPLFFELSCRQTDRQTDILTQPSSVVFILCGYFLVWLSLLCGYFTACVALKILGTKMLCEASCPYVCVVNASQSSCMAWITECKSHTLNITRVVLVFVAERKNNVDPCL